MLIKVIENVYRKMLYTRADENGTIFYFSAEDFEGLNKKPFTFPSSDGHKLQGYFYYYNDYISDKIVFFEHGLGSGHRGYMQEINMLAKHGYLVFSYDHTGCMESGGETTGGFVQSLKDLNDAINAVKSLDEYKNYDISVMGHSWGGFSTMNICALHPEVRNIVAMAGFISVYDILSQFFSGPISFALKKIYANESKANPDFIRYNAVESLKNTQVNALIIHSDDDKTVSFDKNFSVLRKALSDKDNIEFLAITGKNHNPNYTCEAVKYANSFFDTHRKAMKNKTLKTDADKKAFVKKYDWNKMTEQDPKVWEKIFETLDK